MAKNFPKLMKYIKLYITPEPIIIKLLISKDKQQISKSATEEKMCYTVTHHVTGMEQQVGSPQKQ